MRVLKNSATDRWRPWQIPLTSTVLFLPKAPRNSSIADCFYVE